MFRGYDSGYDSPSLVYCLHKYTLASPAEQLPQLIFEGADWPWHSKARFRYDSGYVSGMIRRMIRACNCFWKNRTHRAVSKTFKTMHILCTKSLSHSGDIVWHKNWTQDLTAWLDHHDLPIQLNKMDVSKHGFKIMGMIRSMIRGYDSRVWFGVWFEEMQHACGHKFLYTPFLETLI